MLPTTDSAYLAARYPDHSVVEDAGMICVLLPNWKVPDGYRQDQTDLLLRLSPGYPDVPPDMWWCDPGLVLLNGGAPEATQSIEPYLGRMWQRWSRHFMQPGQWQSGVDSLESYLARTRAEMIRSARQPA
jgi:hypothetical protein